MTEWRGGGGAERRGNLGVSRTVGGVQPQFADGDEGVPPQQGGENVVKSPAHKAKVRVVRYANIGRRKGDPAEAGSRDGILVGRGHGLEEHGVCVAASLNAFAGGARLCR